MRSFFIFLVLTCAGLSLGEDSRLVRTLTFTKLLEEARVEAFDGNPELKAPEPGMIMDRFVWELYDIKQRAPDKDIPDTLELREKIGAILHPTPGTRWVAVALTHSMVNLPGPTVDPLGDEDIVCETGCLTTNAVAIEPSSRHRLFSLIPSKNGNVPISFRVKWKPPSRGIETFVPNERFLPGTLHEQAGEISASYIELSSRYLAFLTSIHPLDLAAATPIVYGWRIFPDIEVAAPEDNKPPHPGQVLRLSKRRVPDVRRAFSYGLLSYVTSFQKALEPGGWFFAKQGHPSPEAAAESLARLSMISEASHTASLKETGSERVAWEERQAFLHQAVPLAALQIFNTYAPAFEQQILTFGDVLPHLIGVRKKLTEGIKAYGSLSTDRTFALLGLAADTLAVEKKDLIDGKMTLKTALIEAEAKVRDRVEKLRERLALTCDILRRMQFSGTRLIPVMKTEERILNLCGK